MWRDESQWVPRSGRFCRGGAFRCVLHTHPRLWYVWSSNDLGAPYNPDFGLCGIKGCRVHPSSLVCGDEVFLPHSEPEGHHLRQPAVKMPHLTLAALRRHPYVCGIKGHGYHTVSLHPSHRGLRRSQLRSCATCIAIRDPRRAPILCALGRKPVRHGPGGKAGGQEVEQLPLLLLQWRGISAGQFSGLPQQTTYSHLVEISRTSARHPAI